MTSTNTSIRTLIKTISKVIREFATGIDTWSAVRHGVVSLDEQPRSEHSSESSHVSRRQPGLPRG